MSRIFDIYIYIFKDTCVFERFGSLDIRVLMDQSVKATPLIVFFGSMNSPIRGNRYIYIYISGWAYMHIYAYMCGRVYVFNDDTLYSHHSQPILITLITYTLNPRVDMQ